MAVATDLAAVTRDDVAPAAPGRRKRSALIARLKDYLPRGNLLTDEIWHRRHAILQWLLLLHLPALIAFGFWMRHTPTMILVTVAPIAVFRVLGGLPTGRRLASFFTTAGIVYCSAALVVLSNGATEAHFHFFIIIGFIALYQDWVPFGWNIAFTVLSHGIGSGLKPNMMFNHMAAMQHPWEWSVIHGVSVLAACIGVVLFWRTNEDEQHKALALTQELGEAEINRRRFTSELLVNLARRNQSLLYRQLDIINQLEHAEQDPDALAGLFRLDHLATRIRRNAENLLVLSGEEPPRVWGKPVPLSDVVRAAIAETEDLSRVTFVVDERLAVIGQAVIDLTHLLAELIENAVRSSPPESQVTIRTTPDVRSPGSVLLTIEDWGVGMPAQQLQEANEGLAEPREVDTLVSNRLGLHVVSRLAARYSLQVVLTTTAGSGITAVVLVPPDLFTTGERPHPGSPSGPKPIASRPAPTRSGSPFDSRPAQLPLNRRSPRPFSADPAMNGAASPSLNGSALGPPTGPSGMPVPESPRSQPSRPAPRPTPVPAVPPAAPSAATPAAPPLDERHGPDWSGWWDAEAEAAAAAAQGRAEARSRWLPVSAPISVPFETPDVDQTRPDHPARPDPAQPDQARPDQAGPDATGPDQPAPDRSDPPETGHGVTVTVSDPLPSNPASTGPVLKLNRRKPQSHMAPELQRDRQASPQQQTAAATGAASPVDAARAREALSRYQASRRAALADHDSEERN